jgi:predicted DNA-binding transcriptional regulator YafY
MGRRSGAETVIGILSAFVERKRWRQADLARRLEMTVPSLRRHLVEMHALVPLVDVREAPDVFWSVPREWNPSGVAFDAADAAALVRLLCRVPRSRERDRLVARIARGDARLTPSPSVGAGDLSREEETFLGVVEDAATKRIALHMKYFTASRVVLEWRHVSVARLLPGPPARFIAKCHRSDTLKSFRVDGISMANLDRDEKFRDGDTNEVARIERESVDGYAGGKKGICSFVVRSPEAHWVGRNLMKGMRAESLDDGSIRVTASARGLQPIARFVVGLGGAARAEGDELAALVRELANGSREAHAAAAPEAKVLKADGVNARAVTRGSIR